MPAENIAIKNMTEVSASDTCIRFSKKSKQSFKLAQNY